MRVAGTNVLATGALVVTVGSESAAVVLSAGLAPLYDTVMFALYNITLVGVGALIVHRRPRHPVGWILAIGGLQGAMMADFAFGWGLRAESEGWTGAAAAQWIGLVSWCPGALMWVLALHYIPTGRLIGRLWRLSVVGAVVGAGAYVFGWLLSPTSVNPSSLIANPFVVDRFPGSELATLGGVMLGLSALGGLASLVVRFRTADDVTRQQLKWVAVAGAVVAATIPIGLVFWSASPEVRLIAPLALMIATAALGAAVLRYRLFDIDVIVLRFVAYTLATTTVVLAYVVAVVALGAVGGRVSSWHVAAATLVAAAAFRPVLGAIQRVIDGRFDRERRAARVLLDAFLDRLRKGIDQPSRIEEVLRAALRDPELTVLLFLPASGQYADVQGRITEVDPGRAVVMIETAGAPEAAVQYAGVPNAKTSARIVQLAEHGRLALQIARLSVELNSEIELLDQSRQRIAYAADEERRRIQRNLHDGAQQRLVAVGLVLRSVESNLRKQGAGEDADRIDALVADLGATIGELRALTTSLPLPQLDAGIGAAFRELAERAPVDVEVEASIERFDAAVETTAYFVGCEGLTNSLKHARATAVTMTATRRAATLVVRVADNGVGGAALRAGSGLAGLSERVAALGGTLHLQSDADGTLLTAELPCA